VAMELALTGDTLSAERALELGLLNRVSEPGEALADARELAARIAANAPLAVRTAKRMTATASDQSIEDGLEQQMPLVQVIRDSADAKEGALAFVEKRPPVWTGR
jgi:enoyl-CoA hydratase